VESIETVVGEGVVEVWLVVVVSEESTVDGAHKGVDTLVFGVKGRPGHIVEAPAVVVLSGICREVVALADEPFNVHSGGAQGKHVGIFAREGGAVGVRCSPVELCTRLEGVMEVGMGLSECSCLVLLVC
jgi:hypothetical protein